MKAKILFIASLFMISAAATQIQQPNPAQQGGLQGLKESYNQQAEDVPSFLANIVGGETINLNLEAGNQTRTLGVKFNGIKIENISRSEMNDPTMKANISRKAISSIGKAEKPYEELQNQMENGNIEYETTTIEAGIKLKIMKTIGGVASALGSML